TDCPKSGELMLPIGAAGLTRLKRFWAETDTVTPRPPSPPRPPPPSPRPPPRPPNPPPPKPPPRPPGPPPGRPPPGGGSDVWPPFPLNGIVLLSRRFTTTKPGP